MSDNCTKLHNWTSNNGLSAIYISLLNYVDSKMTNYIKPGLLPFEMFPFSFVTIFYLFLFVKCLFSKLAKTNLIAKLQNT